MNDDQRAVGKQGAGAGTDSARGADRRPGKTLFIILESGAALRNILRTDVFRVLKARDRLRIVIFSPITDDEFKREVRASNVLVEPLPERRLNIPARWIRSLKKDIWAEGAGLFTFSAKRSKKEGRFLRGSLLRLLVGDKSPKRLESLVRYLDRLEAACTPLMGSEYFDLYGPDLVFYTTLYYQTHCLEIGAQQRGIKTAAFVQSWDNPTSKGPFPVRPDRVILWNNILRDELIQHHRFRPEQLYVSGVPQFDIYTDRKAYSSRDDFFQKWGLDPNRKLITYTTGTPGTAPFDHEVVELLYQAMQRGDVRQPNQLLVRLHPKDRYDDYLRFEKQAGLVLQRPGRRASTQDSWNPTREDMYGLAELMCYSDVVINVASTITIDAAAFDTPVVNVAFDGFTTKPFAKSCLRYYQYEHYRRIVQSEGVKVANSPAEMVEYVNRYLENPKLEAEGRRIIREEQCWRLDGKAGERIANYLLSYLDE